ncbi:MAG TPA: transposase [Acidimicrobiales bacterium]|nr:transposase [Acidimicrobiales bacterium]
MQIAATMPLRKSKHGWIVPSQTGHGAYVVSLLHPIEADASQWGCDCPDYELRGLPCKHVFAVEITVRREYGADGEVVAEEVKVTYTQAWTAYNAAQCHEKETFLPMLADLCSTIPQAPQGRGRPRLPMSDMAFEAISRVYSGLSARRFDSDVREAHDKGLTDSDPHFNSVLRYLRSPEMTPILKELVTLSALPLKEIEQDFAADSSGFTTSRFVRWYDHKWGKEQSKREWVKLHAMTGVLTNVVTAVEMTGYKGADSPQFPQLVADTAANFTLHDVTADKAYSSRKNLQVVADAGGNPYIPFRATTGPFKAGPDAAAAVTAVPNWKPLPWAPAWVKMQHLFAYQRDTFLTRYHQRSNVETTFSMIKRKFGDSLRSKSDTGMMNEVLCKVVAHNLCCLIGAIHEMGLEMPQFAERQG